MMNKKSIIIILCVALCLVLATVGIIFAVLVTNSSDDGVSQVSASSSESVKSRIIIGNTSGASGETVTVPVEIKDNPGIMAYMLDFGYDTDVFEYAGYEKGDFLTDYSLNDRDGKVSFINLEEKDVSTNGVLLKLKFKIKDGASAGDYKISLKCGEGNICNFDEESIIPDVTEGNITVK